MEDVEMRLKFQRIEDTLKGQDTSLVRIEKTLEEVKETQKYANGKTAAVIKQLEQWKGAGKMLGIVCVLIILPLAGWVLYNQTQEAKRINTAISTYVPLYIKQNYNVNP